MADAVLAANFTMTDGSGDLYERRPHWNLEMEIPRTRARARRIRLRRHLLRVGATAGHPPGLAALTSTSTQTPWDKYEQDELPFERGEQLHSEQHERNLHSHEASFDAEPNSTAKLEHHFVADVAPNANRLEQFYIGDDEGGGGARGALETIYENVDWLAPEAFVEDADDQVNATVYQQSSVEDTQSPVDWNLVFGSVLANPIVNYLTQSPRHEGFWRRTMRPEQRMRLLPHHEAPA